MKISVLIVVLIAVLGLFGIAWSQAEQSPARYDLGENYELVVYSLDYSQVNHSLLLKVVARGSEDPLSVLLTETGTVEVFRTVELDTPSYQVFTVLISTDSLLGGRADPCVIYLPTTQGQVLADCR